MQNPGIGDIVWCCFPQLADFKKPGPKPRPALVLGTDYTQTPALLRVAYGTSKKLESIHRGEFIISPLDDPGFVVSGLATATKFNLKNAVVLPYLAPWFGIAPSKQNCILGRLDSSLMQRARTAFEMVQPKL